ncbi:MAG: phytoene dehydrogenase [Sphingobacteriales bacterium 39-19]|nr:phytoene desaturase [Sphingobacteriales bacterium]OJW08441.1 MAG: phytoene dehydrogenase [Sphingobacteriales bacterium 39-19]
MAPKAIIIGSGVAGLSAAIRLAIQGIEVSVYEKNEVAGGKLGSLQKQGYQFDTGPSLFTEPYLLQSLFDLAGERMDDYLTYEKCDDLCHYFFESGKKITAHADIDRFAREMEEQLGEPAEHTKQYLQKAGKLFNSVGDIFLNNSLHKTNTWFHRRVIKALKQVKINHVIGNLDSFNAAAFRTPEAVQLFNRYATYNGSSPYNTPGMLSMIPHVEYNEGVYYPHGGMIKIIEALQSLAEKKGVRFYFNTAVDRIIYNSGSVQGVVVNHQNILADMVISNADIYFTYSHLLGRKVQAQKLLKQPRSSSAIVFYWGIKKTYPALGLHNIFFSNNYKAEFQAIFNKHSVYQDPTVYINITSKKEQGHAPAGSENWFVMVNTAAHTGQDWETLQKETKAAVLKKLQRLLGAEIEKYIEFEQVLNPSLIAGQTWAYEGALYGAASNNKFSAFLRPPNFFKKIKGLYCCGGTVHPGGGIPLCLRSAKISAEIIQRDFLTLKHRP